MVHQPTGIDPEIKLLKSTLFNLIQDYMIKYLALTVHWLWATEELPSQIWSKLAHLDIVDIKSTQYYQRGEVKKQSHSKVRRGRYTHLLLRLFCDWGVWPLRQLTTFTALGTPHWHIGCSWTWSSRHHQRRNEAVALSVTKEVPILIVSYTIHICFCRRSLHQSKCLLIDLNQCVTWRVPWRPRGWFITPLEMFLKVPTTSPQIVPWIITWHWLWDGFGHAKNFLPRFGPDLPTWMLFIILV